MKIEMMEMEIVINADGQAFPKFPKQQVCNVFTISQKRSQRWIWFFPWRYGWKSPTNRYYDSWWGWSIYQSSQNRKFVMSLQLQYHRKKVRYEVDFLHADKYQSFLQVVFNILCITVYFMVILSLLMGMIKYSQSTPSNRLSMSHKRSYS